MKTNCTVFRFGDVSETCNSLSSAIAKSMVEDFDWAEQLEFHRSSDQLSQLPGLKFVEISTNNSFAIVVEAIEDAQIFSIQASLHFKKKIFWGLFGTKETVKQYEQDYSYSKCLRLLDLFLEEKFSSLKNELE